MHNFISKLQELLGIQIYLVGGAVRDYLLDKEVQDFDFTTPTSPDEIEAAIRKIGKKPYITGKRFGTVGFYLQPEDLEDKSAESQQGARRSDIDIEPKTPLSRGVLPERVPWRTKSERVFATGGTFQRNKLFIEITTFRGEKYEPGNRKPNVEFVESLSEDLSRRDFTINAMAMDGGGKLIDQFGGQEDLELKQIKTVGTPKTRFKEDPLRILRAIRFATTLGFEIEETTLKKISQTKWTLLEISKERWVQELDKILAHPDVVKGLNLMVTTQIMRVILPEVSLMENFDQNSPYHKWDLWTHTKKVVEAVPPENLELRWVALLHDVGKAFTRTWNNRGYSNYIRHELVSAEIAQKICHYLKFSKDRTDFIVNEVRGHMHPDSILKEFDVKGMG